MPVLVLGAAALAASPVPAGTSQLLLGVAPDNDASSASLTRWTRAGAGWTAVGAPIAVRLGAEGLAWGRGLHPTQPGLQKVEGDDRAPAGVFRVGDAYGYAPTPAPGVTWPYHPVGERDLWIEDPASPAYNAHLRVEGDRPLEPWESEAVMRLNDPSHALKVFVAHNAPPAVPGAGSAIFLHVWRAEGDKATAGCTSMARSDLDVVVAWLRPEAEPVYVLLAADQLAALGAAWGLPRAADETPP